MWQNKTQKMRAQAEAKKKEREYARQHIHFKRISAFIQVLSVTSVENDQLPKIEARVILNDLSEKGVGLYCQDPLDPEQEILLTFEKPHFLEITANVIWCQNNNANSHIISSQPFGYRIGVEFIPKSDEEKQKISAFCKEMTQTYLNPPKS